MTFNNPITPDTVARILGRVNPQYRRMHEMNQHVPEIAGCKIGQVFRSGDEYFIYVGVNGRNRKFPCIAMRESDRHLRKFTFAMFAKIAKSGS